MNHSCDATIPSVVLVEMCDCKSRRRCYGLVLIMIKMVHTSISNTTDAIILVYASSKVAIYERCATLEGEGIRSMVTLGNAVYSLLFTKIYCKKN